MLEEMNLQVEDETLKSRSISSQSIHPVLLDLMSQVKLGTKHSMPTGFVWPGLHCAGLETALSCHLMRCGVSGSPSVSIEGLFTGFIKVSPPGHRAIK